MKKILLYTATVLTAVCAYSQAPNTWVKKTDFGGGARAGAVAFSIGNKGYIGTGQSGSSENFRDLWEYDPATDTWNQKADFGGVARLRAVGFSIDGKGYLGTGDNDTIGLSDFWQYDPIINSWIQKADFGGGKRSVAVGFSIGSKGYIGTGYVGTTDLRKNDFWEYDPAPDSWTQKANFGGATRDHAVGFSIGSKGYIGGGWAYVFGPIYTDFWVYDPSTNSWQKKANFPGPARVDAVGFSIGNKGYFGTGAPNNQIHYKDFWEYDPSSNKWTQKADFGAPRQFPVGFSIGSKGYIGTGNESSGAKADFWEYTPDVCKGLTVYVDADNDGYGNAADTLFVADCKLPEGYVYNSTDCNDKKASVHPGATEIIGDGIDNNCNGHVDEKLNNSLSFDGVNDYIKVNSAVGIPIGNSSYTIEAQIKPDVHGANTIAGWGNYGINNQVNAFRLGTSNTIHNYWWGNDLIVTVPNLADGNWHHVAATFDGTKRKIYLDGSLVGQDNPVGHNIPPIANWWIGYYSAAEYFRGRLDEVRIWNVARTQAEIQSDMHSTGCRNAPGLVAYYPFNQGIAGGNNTNQITADDITSNNNDGTLINFALTGSKSNWVKGVPGLSDSVTLYRDADGDTFGNAGKSIRVSACKPRAGYVSDSTDCNDANASIHPSAREVCNGIDDNCNGLIDDISGLTTTNITATTATFNWKKLPGARAYFIKYRRRDPSVTTWSKTGAAASAIGVIISGLRPNSNYEWMIRSDCGGLNAAFSGPVKFKTAAALSAGEQEESIKLIATGLLVYPNPGDGNMTVSLLLSKPQAVFISVFDIVGKEVYASNEGIVSGAYTHQLDLSKLNPGTYFLKLIHDGKSEIKKIVVKK